MDKDRYFIIALSQINNQDVKLKKHYPATQAKKTYLELNFYSRFDFDLDQVYIGCGKTRMRN